MQPICVCGPTIVCSKFAKIRAHVKKQKCNYSHVFSCFARGIDFKTIGGR